MEHATVSVVIPCYGQAHFLREAIESVIAQAHPAEIVVVDDGSPDNTAEVAARYPQVRYVRQENKGLAEARNSGFRVATGDYLMFLDADDRLTPNAVEAHLKCFTEHPEAQLTVGDIDHIAEDGSYLGSPRWPMLKANFYEELLKVNHIANTIAVMMRREVVANVGGFEAELFASRGLQTASSSCSALSQRASSHGRSAIPAISHEPVAQRCSDAARAAPRHGFGVAFGAGESTAGKGAPNRRALLARSLWTGGDPRADQQHRAGQASAGRRNIGRARPLRRGSCTRDTVEIS